MSILGEFLKQVIVAIFFLIVIICAVKLGIAMAKKKNAKNESMEQNQ